MKAAASAPQGTPKVGGAAPKAPGSPQVCPGIAWHRMASLSLRSQRTLHRLAAVSREISVVRSGREASGTGVTTTSPASAGAAVTVPDVPEGPANPFASNAFLHEAAGAAPKAPAVSPLSAAAVMEDTAARKL